MTGKRQPASVSEDAFLLGVARQKLGEWEPIADSSEGATITKEDLVALEADWRGWAKELFPNYVKGAFSPAQGDLWEWGARLKRGQLPGLHFGAFWPRGHAKSSTVAMLIIFLAATERRRYVLLVSRTQKQAEKHLRAIMRMLESARIERYYPHLGSRAMTKFNVHQNWNGTRVVTAGGLVIDAVGLDVASRGLRYEDLRPDLVVLDDIDKRHDTPLMTRKVEEILTDSIFPAGSKDVAVVFAQNVIREGSVAWKVAQKKSDFLANIQRSGPYAAFRSVKIEASSKFEGGYELLEGVPSWEYFDLREGQHLLNLLGYQSFMREVQQNFKTFAKGYIFRQLWNPRVHVVTMSEFRRVYGAQTVVPATRATPERIRVPERWRKACMQDFGTTDEGRCATLWAARPAETDPWNDTVFVYRELVTPNPFGFDSLLDDGPDDELPLEERELVTANRVGVAIWKVEQRDREGASMDYRVMSHEQKSARNLYRRDLGVFLKNPKARLVFSPFNTSQGKATGIETIKSLLDPIKEPNPFRRFPAGHPEEGEHLWGRPRIVFLVEDGQGGLVYDETHDDQVFVEEAVDSRGLAYTRWEIEQYRWDVNALGEIKEDVPYAKDNHAMDALRMGFEWFGPHVLRATSEEKVSVRMQTEYDQFNEEAIAARPDEASKAAALATRAMLEERLRLEEERRKGGVVEHRSTRRAKTEAARRRGSKEDRRWL